MADDPTAACLRGSGTTVSAWCWEITTKLVDVQLAREVIADIGFTDAKMASMPRLRVLNTIQSQCRYRHGREPAAPTRHDVRYAR